VQELLVSFLMVVLLFVEKNQARKKSIEFKIQKKQKNQNNNTANTTSNYTR